MTDTPPSPIGTVVFACGASLSCSVVAFRARQDTQRRLHLVTYDVDAPDRPGYRPMLNGTPAPCLACPTPTERYQAGTYSREAGFSDNGSVRCRGRLAGDEVLGPPRQVVLYHAECIDGIVAAWAVWKAWGDSADYIPVRSGARAPIEVCQDADVAIVDMSFSRGSVEEIRRVARRMVLLDHHESATRELAGVEGCVVDESRSGAGLAWDHFHHPGEPRPWIIDYVEDADLYHFALENSREVNAWIAAQPFTIDAVDALCARVDDEGLDVAVASGEIARTVVDRYVEAVVKEAHAALLGGYVVPVVNAPRPYVTEVVNKLCEGWPFAAAWHVLADGRVKYSLRSDRGPDASNVADIAERFPGGRGHAHAASFTVDAIVHEVIGGPAIAREPEGSAITRLRARSGRVKPAKHAKRVVTVDGAPKVTARLYVGAVHMGTDGATEREAPRPLVGAETPPWKPMRGPGDE